MGEFFKKKGLHEKANTRKDIVINKIKLDKFDGQNYTSFKFQLNLAIAAKELTSYVNGSNIKPELASTDNNCCIDTGRCACNVTHSPDVVNNSKPLLFGCTASKNMTIKLETTYAMKSQVAKQSTWEPHGGSYNIGCRRFYSNSHIKY